MSRLRIRRKTEKPDDIETRYAALQARYDKLRDRHHKGIDLYNDLLQKLVDFNLATKDANGQIHLRDASARGIRNMEQQHQDIEESIERAAEEILERTDTRSRLLSSYSAIEIYTQATTWFMVKVIFNWMVKHSGKLLISVFGIWALVEYLSK